MKILRVASFTLFIYTLLGWIYIVLNSEIHMWTLSMPLTHLLPFPREDTFGEICFAISFISFFVWNLVKDENKLNKEEPDKRIK